MRGAAGKPLATMQARSRWMTNCFESKEGHGSNAPALHEVMCVSFSIAGLMPSEWSRNGRVLPGCSRSVRLGS